MKKAFLNLVEVLWRFGNAGQIASIVILLRDGSPTMVSVVGALKTKRTSVKDLLVFARDRKNEMAPSLPFSNEVYEAVSTLVDELGKGQNTRYTLIIMHPSSSAQDVLVESGIYGIPESTPGALAYSRGMLALSLYQRAEIIKHVIPLLHQPGAVVREEEPLPA